MNDLKIRRELKGNFSPSWTH